MSEGAKRFMAGALAGTEELDVAGYAVRWQTRQALARQWSLFQAQTPLILAPVCLQPPFGPDADISEPDAPAKMPETLQMVIPVNLLGLPSAAVSAGLDEDGLPLGVQVIGARFREDLCLDAAAAIEAALGSNTPIDPRRRQHGLRRWRSFIRWTPAPVCSTEIRSALIAPTGQATSSYARARGPAVGPVGTTRRDAPG